MRGLYPITGKVREYRRKRKPPLTQQELADKAGVDVRTIRKMENEENRRDKHHWSVVADVLGVDIELIADLNSSAERKRTHFNVVSKFMTAFANRDIDCLISLCCPEVKIEVPGEYGFPLTGVFIGIENERERLERLFELIANVNFRDKRIEVGEEIVVLHTLLTGTAVLTGETFKIRLSNMFRFVREKISHRIVTSEFTELRKCLGLNAIQI